MRYGASPSGGVSQEAWSEGFATGGRGTRKRSQRPKAAARRVDSGRGPLWGQGGRPPPGRYKLGTYRRCN
jgi:hypothetical protein